MNAQADTGTRSTSTAPWEAAPSEGSAVGARACAKNVYNSLLGEVARKSGPGAGPEENVRRFEASPPGGCDDKPLVWTLCVEASIGTVPPFRARKGGQVEVLGTASEGEAPIDKKGNQEKTVRQLAAWQGIPEGEGPPGAD